MDIATLEPEGIFVVLCPRCGQKMQDYFWLFLCQECKTLIPFVTYFQK